MSGRRMPLSELIVDCTVKSTRLRRPADSTSVRSCVSPHTPRVALLRRADASDSAVARRRSSDSVADFSCCDSSPCCWLRWVSSSLTFACIVVSVSLTGASACSTLLSAAAAVSRSFASARARSITSRYCSCVDDELLAQPADRRLGGRELRRDLGTGLRLLRSQLGHQLRRDGPR